MNETYRKLIIEQGYCELTWKDFDDCFQWYQQTTNLLDDREEAISNLANEIETEIILCGLTAVEDKLQDGVSKAIKMLRCAGIKIWLLTGDKQETASLINSPQTLLYMIKILEIKLVLQRVMCFLNYFW